MMLAQIPSRDDEERDVRRKAIKGAIMLEQRVKRIEAVVNRSGCARTKPPPRRLQTAQDVIDLLQEQVEAIRAEAFTGTLEKARAIGYLAGIAHKAIESGNMAARIEMLETILKQRRADGK
jgi:hypothetical protein